MITAGRQRRVLPWGKGGRQGLENSDGGRGYAPSAPTRGETFWLLLQQKQQTRSMPQSAWNENLPWTSDSKKWVSKLEEAARFRQPVPWHLIRIMLLSMGASAQPQLPPTRRGWISPVTCIMGCFASYPPSMLPAFVSASSVGRSVLFWGSEWLSQGQATWLTRWCHSPGVKMDGLPIHRALRAHPTSRRAAVPNLFGTRDLFHGRQFFPWTGGWGEQLLDDSSTLHITLVIQFLLLLHQLHFRSSGVRSQRLGFSYTAEPRGHGSKKRVDWLTGGWQGDSVIELCYSRCGPWTGGTGITRESIKNAESQASAQTFWIRKSFEPDSQEIYMTIKERDELV